LPHIMNIFRLFLFQVIFPITAVSVLFASPAYSGSIATSHFIIEYSGVSEQYARLASDSAERILPRIAKALGQSMPERITIFLTGSQDRFNELTAGTLPDWSAAVAVPERRIIFSPLAGHKIDMEKILAHELVHIIIDEASGDAHVPRWFHEGCAELFSGEWGLRNELYMAWKVVRGRMMNFDDIQNVFSTGSLDAGLAYDQSMIAVRHLVNRYGRSVLSRILGSMREGKDFPGAFLKSTGYLPTEFENEYFLYLRKQYGPFSMIALTPSVWTFIMALFLVVYLVKRRRSKLKLAEWTREESLGRTARSVNLEDEEGPEIDFEEYFGDEPDNILKFKPRPKKYGGENDDI